MLSVVMLCRYVECRYADCRGAGRSPASVEHLTEPVSMAELQALISIASLV
jgi:hypothetical protein